MGFNSGFKGLITSFRALWSRSIRTLILQKVGGEHAVQSGHCKAGLPLVLCRIISLICCYQYSGQSHHSFFFLLQANSTLCNVHNTILPVKALRRFRSGCKPLVLWIVSCIIIINSVSMSMFLKILYCAHFLQWVCDDVRLSRI